MITREELISVLLSGGIAIEDPNSDNLEDLILDSVQYISLLVHLEVEFEIEIPEEYLGTSFLSTISSLLETINEIKKNTNIPESNSETR